MLKISQNDGITWDVIYVEISFFTIHNFTIKGFGTENIIDYFEINTIEEGLLKIKCKNQMLVECSFEWAKVEGGNPRFNRVTIILMGSRQLICIVFIF